MRTNQLVSRQTRYVLMRNPDDLCFGAVLALHIEVSLTLIQRESLFRNG